MKAPEGFWLHFFGEGGTHSSNLYTSIVVLLKCFFTFKYLGQKPTFYDIDLCIFMESFHRHENIGDLVSINASGFTDDNPPTKQEIKPKLMEMCIVYTHIYTLIQYIPDFQFDHLYYSWLDITIKGMIKWCKNIFNKSRSWYIWLLKKSILFWLYLYKMKTDYINGELTKV